MDGQVGQFEFPESGDLSSRVDRVWAVLVDGALGAVFPVLGLLGGFSWASSALLSAAATGRPPSIASRPTGAVATLLIASGVASLLLALYQWWGLAVRGQTLGKQLLGIQIVDMSGRPAGFLRAVVLRSWVFGLLAGLAQGCLRVPGALVPIADALFIFSAERRCLHDYVAGTWVRDTAAPGRRALPALAVFGSLAVVLGVLLAQAGVNLRLSELKQLAANPALVPGGSTGADPFANQEPGAVGTPSGTPKPGPHDDVNLSPKIKNRIYRYEDDSGAIQFSGDLDSIPRKYRARARPIE